MNSRIVGALIKDPAAPAWRKSKDVLSKEATATPLFDHKKIKYCFAFDESKTLTLAAADAALEKFFDLKSALKDEIAEKSFENWEAFNDAVGYLDGIETYRSVKDRPDWMEQALQSCLRLEKLTEATKVWEYIHPTEIIICKDRYQKKEGVYIQILCNCEWEEEHGLQIVLKDGMELTRVSEQDGNLFDY